MLLKLLKKKKHKVKNKEALRSLRTLRLFYNELWLVENRMTSEREKASTFQWVVYKNREDALRWIQLCSLHFTGKDISDEVKELKVGESDEVAFSYLDSLGGTISERFIVTHYCGES